MSTQVRATPALNPLRLIRRGWRRLISMRTALILLFLLAIAAVPGAFVPPNQQGWDQVVYIRGGSYDQIGYEFDGVPVNRSFDNYPGGTAGTLGQQELQDGARHISRRSRSESRRARP